VQPSDRPSASVALRALSETFAEARVTVVNEIHRRNSDLYILTVEAQGKFVVKYERDSSAEKLEAIASNASTMARVLTAASDSVGVVKIVAQTASPFGLVMEHVDGDDLSTVIARAASGSASLDDAQRARKFVTLAGLALGAVHAGGVEVVQTESDLLDRVRRRFRLGPAWAEEAQDLLEMVCSGGDFAPYNLKVTGNGRLCVLDIGSENHVVSAHQDCALFLTGLWRSVHWRPWHYGGRRRRTARHLRKAFLEGYTISGAIDFGDPRQKALLDWVLAYSISNIFAKLIRRRSLNGYFALLRLGPLVWPMMRPRVQLRWAK
jgi:hypothetical protein